MDGIIFDEMNVVQMNIDKGNVSFHDTVKKVIIEISLKIIVNGEELVSLLCLDQFLEELALGFLYNEGIIQTMDDIKKITYNERMKAVIIELKDGIMVDRQESLRSITSGCGKCYTYINPQRQENYQTNLCQETFSAIKLFETMKEFEKCSEVFITIGGVHSVMFRSDELTLLNEDIGRHNCFDKITGMLLKTSKLSLTQRGVLYISGRITSEIVTKLIRLKVPVLVSRTAPTATAVTLAKKYNITLIGYLREDRGVVYTCSERIGL